MINFRYTFLFVLVLLFSTATQAQEISLTTKLDTTVVEIGDHFHLHLRAELNKGELLQFPEITNDSTFAKLELLGVSELDTTLLENDRMALQQSLKLTAWEKGEYILPPLQFTVLRNGKVDTLTARELLLQVGAPAIDTTKAIKDIATVYDTPFNFDEFMERYFVYVLAAVVVIIISLLLFFYFRNREEQPRTVLRRPKVPAHKIAFEELEKLKEEELWQKGEFKAYHTKLTDILKSYAELRYKVTLMELTSHETMMLLKGTPQTNAEANQMLEKIFELADLTKFAKYIPNDQENELSMKNSILFVGLTREELEKKAAEKDKQPAQ